MIPLVPVSTHQSHAVCLLDRLHGQASRKVSENNPNILYLHHHLHEQLSNLTRNKKHLTSSFSIKSHQLLLLYSYLITRYVLCQHLSSVLFMTGKSVIICVFSCPSWILIVSFHDFLGDHMQAPLILSNWSSLGLTYFRMFLFKVMLFSAHTNNAEEGTQSFWYAVSPSYVFSVIG